jgi:2'-5' RNA ligase
MANIRCFVAIALPSDLKNNLTILVAQLKKQEPSIRWVKIENIHLTLKFLGEITYQQVEAVQHALEATAANFSPFVLKTTQVNLFPNKNKPRVIWLGLEENDMLSRLQQQIETTTSSLGFAREKRPFTPHLTLGRMRYPQNFNDLYNYVHNHPLPPYEIAVKAYILMRSVLKPEGAIYSPIYRYSLDINHK